MRISFILPGVLALFFAFDSAPAYAGAVKDFFFPSLKEKEYNPYETLQAPFADAPAEDAAPASIEERLQERPEDHVPMHLPHVNEGEIVQWVVTGTSNAMMFEGGDFDEMLERVRGTFTEEGFEQYKAFLSEQHIEKNVRGGHYAVRSFVEGRPLLLNKGAVGGVYRWLYEVPVMMSYVPRGASSYKNVEPVNQVFELQVQVGRTKPGSPHTILLERWSGKRVD